MSRVPRDPRPIPSGNVGRSISGEVRGGVAIGLAAVAVLAFGATVRAMLEEKRPEIAVETTRTYQTTGDNWFDQLMDPSAWHSGRLFRSRPRSRDDDRAKQDEDWSERRGYVPARGTYRTVCVRLCDGYFFPISFATTPGRFAADEDTCHSRCRTPARLFVYPNPGGEPEQMVDVKGEPYTALKTAFLFRTTYNESCTCKPHPWEQEARDRHRLYAERAQGKKPAVAAKVQPAPREAASVDPVADPAEPKMEVASEPPPPRRPRGAMLLGAEARRPPAAESQPRRERGSVNSGRRGYGGRSDWRDRAFNSD